MASLSAVQSVQTDVMQFTAIDTVAANIWVEFDSFWNQFHFNANYCFAWLAFVCVYWNFGVKNIGTSYCFVLERPHRFVVSNLYNCIILCLCNVVSCVVCIVVSCLLCIVVVVVCISSTMCVLLFFTLGAVLLALSQYSESPRNGHLNTGFSWFPWVYKQKLRWFPTFQVATTCFSLIPSDLTLLVTKFIFSIHVK